MSKGEQENQHERSFAIYQTTAGNHEITGSASLEMNEILDTLEEKPKIEIKPSHSPKQS